MKNHFMGNFFFHSVLDEGEHKVAVRPTMSLLKAETRVAAQLLYCSRVHTYRLPFKGRIRDLVNESTQK